MWAHFKVVVAIKNYEKRRGAGSASTKLPARARAYLLNFTARICTKGQQQQARAVGYESQAAREIGGEREGEEGPGVAAGFLFITATCIAFCLYAFNAISTLFTLIYAQASECLKGGQRQRSRLNDKP